MRVQSADITKEDMLKTHEGEGSTRIQQENVGFAHEEGGMELDIPHPVDYTKGDSSQNVTLSNFLSRPVKIHTQNWTVGSGFSPITDNFRPWHLFFNNAAIKRKLDNYYLLRCNLHLEVIINASPFYYGGAILSYEPLTNFNPAPVRLGAAGQELVLFSQRPHVNIYPQTNQGGSMTLPFLYYKEYLDATNSQDLIDMGECVFASYTDLLNANGAVGTDVTIQIYAWATDVELAGPTVKLAVQSGDKKKNKPKHVPHRDEYHHEGTISRPASAIARATGMLGEIPVIGPFMTATSYAADAVSNIASLFGFTDVPVIDDVHQFKNQPFPQLAATDIGIPIEKATLDCKNELSIDPRICGVDLGDELLISNIVTRESFLANATWQASQTEDTLLFNAEVGPTMKEVESVSGAVVLYNTPMSYVSTMFHYWRGDITFRIKFVASQYHRGRVKISWDPIGDIANTAESTSEVYTKIVDISETTDVTFVVPYTQDTAYLPINQTVTERDFSTSAAFSPGAGYNNGILTMRVLTQQTSPVASADIHCLVFVAGCENLEFADPADLNTRLSPYAVQSGNFAYDQTDMQYIGVAASKADDNINLTYMGETVKSLRTLFRRTSDYIYLKWEYTHDAADTRVRVYSLIRRLLCYPGFETSDGFYSSNGINLSGPFRYNYVNWHPMSWMSLCFVGTRGSVNYQVNAVTNGYVRSVSISRSQGTALSLADFRNVITDAAKNANGDARNYANNIAYGAEGYSKTNQRTQAAVSLSLPMYSQLKFYSNNYLTRNLGSTSDDSTNDGVYINAVLNPAADGDTSGGGFEVMTSAGTDFNLIFFLNAPTIYFYNSYPTAV